MKYASLTIGKGIFGYVLIITFSLIFYPNEVAFAVRLADHLIYLCIFWWGAALFDGIELIMSLWKCRRSSSKETQE